MIDQPDTKPRTPCGPPPQQCDDEPCAQHEEEQAHAEGEHAFCGPTCETEYPTDILRNSMLAWAPPGGKRILAELERRAACQPPADRSAVCICGHTEAQHVEDACFVCDCGDYLSPAAAREEIARLTQAAAPCADRAVLRDRIAQAVRHYPGCTPLTDGACYRIADAVLAVLSPPTDQAADDRCAVCHRPATGSHPAVCFPPALTDRAAVLAEMEQHVRQYARDAVHPDYRAAYTAIANDLRGMAAAYPDDTPGATP